MKRAGIGRFIGGVLGGWALVGVGAIALGQLAPQIEFARLGTWGASTARGAWAFIDLNLQGSVLPFTLVLLVYAIQLLRLQGLLAEPQPDPGRVVRAEQYLDLCASLFFGIGVIWTAIGMRDALLFALGDLDTMAAGSAFAVLQRLVEGGILLALSTTIVGGIGGYLMRSVKSVWLGQQLNALYMEESSRPGREHLATLLRIERRLARGERE